MSPRADEAPSADFGVPQSSSDIDLLSQWFPRCSPSAGLTESESRHNPDGQDFEFLLTDLQVDRFRT